MTDIDLSKRAALYAKLYRAMAALTTDVYVLSATETALEELGGKSESAMTHHRQRKSSLEAAIERNVAEADKALAEIIDGLLPLSNNPPTIFAIDVKSYEIADALLNSDDLGGPSGPQK